MIEAAGTAKIEEQWTGVADAVNLVAEYTQASLGMARVRLRGAIREGVIRSRGVRIDPSDVGGPVIASVVALEDAGLDGVRFDWDGAWPNDESRLGLRNLIIEVSHADLLYWLGAAEPRPARQQNPNRGGAPRKHNRDAFYWKVISIADLDGLPQEQTELTRIMREWCHTNWPDSPPDDRTVREWVRDICANRAG